MMVAAVAALIAAGGSELPPTPADQVITTVGEYVAPGGDARVRIDEVGTGELNFVFESASGSQRPAKPFPSTRQWMMAWGDRGRLWTYVEGDAVRVWYANGQASGSIRVGVFGGWEDVPRTFLARLPVSEREKCRIALSSDKG